MKRAIALCMLPIATLAPSEGRAQSVVSDLDTRLWQAVIAGGFIAIGWFVTFFFQEFRRTKERDEQRRELQSAFRAEISDFEVRDDFDGLEAHAATMSDAILSGGDGADKFRVFVPEQRNMLVFDALKDRITNLDAGTTDPVIWYYSQMEDVQALATDLRSAAFAELPATRRAQAYRHYIQLIIEAKRRARVAISSLNEALGEARASDENSRSIRRAERAADLRDWINNRAGGQNDL